MANESPIDLVKKAATDALEKHEALKNLDNSVEERIKTAGGQTNTAEAHINEQIKFWLGGLGDPKARLVTSPDGSRAMRISISTKESEGMKLAKGAAQITGTGKLAGDLIGAGMQKFLTTYFPNVAGDDRMETVDIPLNNAAAFIFDLKKNAPQSPFSVEQFKTAGKLFGF